MSDIDKLALCSEMAKRYGNSYEIINVNEYRNNQTDDLSFHPNGNCGCIQLDDDYAFDIRCNHLMWAEGVCEGSEYFWTENDHKVAENKYEQNEHEVYNVILVYGNHKGSLVTKLIVFHEA